jgi:3-oxoadipate CoA-transferase alpha subunit
VDQVAHAVPVGGLDPETVVTPCLYVDRVVPVERRGTELEEPGQ